MGMTMTQKILADHANLKEVKKGQLIEAKLDLVLGNDITTPVAIKEFEKLNINKVFDESKVAIVLDHFTPNKDIKSAEQCKVARNFANCKNIKNYFDVGNMGIEHCLLPEKGLVSAGDVVIGADSHTCTYGALGLFSTGIGSTDMAAGMATGKAWFKVPGAIKFILKNKPSKWISGKDIILHIIGKIGVDGARYMSMEFVGDGIKYLSMDDRFTICNMAIEAGAKNGIFPVDNITEEYIKNHPCKTIDKNPKIYIFAGKARSGKDTSADFIKKYYENDGKSVVTLQYSTYLKEYAKKITNWSGSDQDKPRQLFIELGTDLLRGKIDKYLFVNRRIEDIIVMSYFFDVIVISDARLIEELEIPREKLKNVKIINIKRPNFDNGLTKEQQKSLTESALDNYTNYDYSIINDGTLENLNEKIIKMLKEMN